MFHKLKLYLRGHDFTQKYLCRKLERSQTYITECLNGRGSLTLYEVYELCKIVGIPLDQIADYFPPDEVEKSKKRKDVTPWQQD